MQAKKPPKKNDWGHYPAKCFDDPEIREEGKALTYDGLRSHKATTYRRLWGRMLSQPDDVLALALERRTVFHGMSAGFTEECRKAFCKYAVEVGDFEEVFLSAFITRMPTVHYFIGGWNARDCADKG
jgi:hypothetical protein